MKTSYLFLLFSLLHLTLTTSTQATTYSTKLPASKLTTIQQITSRDNGTRTENFVPEGIEYVKRTNTILLSSLAFGSIVAFDLNTGELTTKVLGAGENGTDPNLFTSVGLTYDERTKLLFTPNADRTRLTGGSPPFRDSSVSFVDVVGGKSRSIVVNGSVFLNDLSFARRLNSLFVTDFTGLKIYRVDLPGGRYGRYGRGGVLPKVEDVKVEVFSDDDVLKPAMGMTGPNGIVVHPSNRFLITGTSEDVTSRFIKFRIGGYGERRGKAVGKPYVIPFFDLEGRSLDGKINITGYDGLQFGGRDWNPTEIFGVTRDVVLRFASFDHYRSLTLVERISTDIPECLNATTAADGANNSLYVVCTTFGEPGLSSVATIKVEKLSRGLRQKIKGLEWKRMRKQGQY